jgi:hypothetical protein
VRHRGILMGLDGVTRKNAVDSGCNGVGRSFAPTVIFRAVMSTAGNGIRFLAA